MLNDGRLIPLTQGRFAIVDEADYEWISQWKWHYNCGYARRSRNENGKWVLVIMHRLIANTPKGLDTDHINRNKLDNRRSNLRICRRPLNVLNKDKQQNNTSGFTGVSFHKGNKKFIARIGTKFLGYFDDPEMAYSEYLKAKNETISELC